MWCFVRAAQGGYKLQALRWLHKQGAPVGDKRELVQGAGAAVACGAGRGSGGQEGAAAGGVGRGRSAEEAAALLRS